MKIKLFINKLIRQPNEIIIKLVFIYQKTISPLLGERCRYWPSCSRYAVGSLQNHNFFKAVILSSWRIIKCNPFSEGGLDPVPITGRWRPDINTDGTPRTRP